MANDGNVGVDCKLWGKKRRRRLKIQILTSINCVLNVNSTLLYEV